MTKPLLAHNLEHSPMNDTELLISLSRLVDAIEQDQEREIVIAKSGRPAARPEPMEPSPPASRIGVAKGLFTVPDNIDAHSDEVFNLSFSNVCS